MQTTKEAIVAAAERVFDTHGFAASGVDRVTEAAGVSSRTLYKHLGSKSGMTVAVLEARASRFFTHLAVNDTQGQPSVARLFGSLESWILAEGARGCLFLRAQRETGGADPAVNAAVARYRERLRELVGSLVEAEVGRADETVALQILILFEGATTAASYTGAAAVRAAQDAATALLARPDTAQR